MMKRVIYVLHFVHNYIQCTTFLPYTQGCPNVLPLERHYSYLQTGKLSSALYSGWIQFYPTDSWVLIATLARRRRIILEQVYQSLNIPLRRFVHRRRLYIRPVGSRASCRLSWILSVRSTFVLCCKVVLTFESLEESLIHESLFQMTELLSTGRLSCGVVQFALNDFNKKDFI